MSVLPLHRSRIFTCWLIFSVITTIALTNWLTPLGFISKAVILNTPEQFKVSLAYAGFCITILTIISLVHRSIETNEQINLSNKQFKFATNQANIQLKIKLMEQANLTTATIMRLQDRAFHFNSLIDNAVNTYELEFKVHKKIHSAIKVNISESYRIYESMLDNSAELLNHISQPVQQNIDAKLYGAFQAVSIWFDDPYEVSTKELTSARMNIQPLKDFESQARNASLQASKRLQVAY
ncbi:hypothetical protein DN730_16045 [Marinomonas piezotolerans]|uniref:Uncharacterized protein n=1 Tax=Marinomonas piezotolerans TaxID=2213058 RepID=A0A370U5F5_9GAMM|nr:hypothetical protein [Marinomonas piezotolerans]RDL43016.1 hypothetical protein DN730_16045 [Marinomonas piezotolerans]